MRGCGVWPMRRSSVFAWACAVALGVALCATCAAQDNKAQEGPFAGFGEEVPAPELPQLDLPLNALGVGSLFGSLGAGSSHGMAGGLGALLSLISGVAESGALSQGEGELPQNAQPQAPGQVDAANQALLGQLGNLAALINIKPLLALLEAYRAGAENDPEAILDHIDQLDAIKGEATAANLEALFALLQMLAGAQLAQGQGGEQGGAGGLDQLGALGALLGAPGALPPGAEGQLPLGALLGPLLQGGGGAGEQGAQLDALLNLLGNLGQAQPEQQPPEQGKQ